MKCPHCKKVPYPAKDENGKPIWKNILRIDFGMVLFVAVVLFAAWGYKHDIAECKEIIENPTDYCEPVCESIENQINTIEPQENYSLNFFNKKETEGGS